MHVEETLYTIFFQQISQDSCDMIKKGLNLGEGITVSDLSGTGFSLGMYRFSQERRNGKQFLADRNVYPGRHPSYFTGGVRMMHSSRVNNDIGRSRKHPGRFLPFRYNRKSYHGEPHWAVLLGYDPLEDCIGYDIAKNSILSRIAEKNFSIPCSNGSVSDYEVVLKRKDGSPLYVSTNTHLYHDDTGNYLALKEFSGI